MVSELTTCAVCATIIVVVLFILGQKEIAKLPDKYAVTAAIVAVCMECADIQTNHSFLRSKRRRRFSSE